MFGKTSYLFAETKAKDMEQETDVRWIQRYANFHKACG
jgi:hypothetical protein